MLKLIELQYQREIDRRKKQNLKEKLEKEIGEKILDSPLRRAREYAQSIAGSPSPIRRIVTKGTFSFEISPEKTTIELRTKANGDKLPMFDGKPTKNSNEDLQQTPEKRVSAVAAQQRSITKVNNISRGASASKKQQSKVISSAKNFKTTRGQ